nr:hypothetical protein [Tanacetum cinerariifolium]GEW68225.1 hypothetical protein [Tanacetum cinerariifolium]
MEEYIRLEEEKAHRHGKVYNWETAKYAIVYNDALTSKSDFLTEPTLKPRHIDEFDLKDETSLSEYDEVEQKVLYFKDLFSFNTIYLGDLKADKENDDNKIDIIQSLGGNANTQGSKKFLEASHDKIGKVFIMEDFIMELNVNIMVWNYLVNGILFNLIKNLYVPFGIPFNPKRYYKDDVYTIILRRTSQMIDKYFVEYTRIKVKQFRDTLSQHMGNVKNETKSEVQDDSNKPGNDTDADDVDIRPIYDKEPMAEVQLAVECNVFAIGQHHTEQPKIINEGQHGKFFNETSNKAKIKKEIDVLETMNIELEHSLAKLRKENETLKKHYKDLYDSIKIIRSKTIEQTTSLLANNADLKTQIQEMVFAIEALKMT